MCVCVGGGGGEEKKAKGEAYKQTDRERQTDRQTGYLERGEMIMRKRRR